MTENKDSKTINGQFSVSKKCSYSDQMREYRDTSPQIVMSELNQFVRQYQPPRGFCAKVVWEHKATREEVEREKEEGSMINRSSLLRGGGTGPFFFYYEVFLFFCFIVFLYMSAGCVSTIRT